MVLAEKVCLCDTWSRKGWFALLMTPSIDKRYRWRDSEVKLGAPALPVVAPKSRLFVPKIKFPIVPILILTVPYIQVDSTF